MKESDSESIPIYEIVQLPESLQLNTNENLDEGIYVCMQQKIPSIIRESVKNIQNNVLKIKENILPRTTNEENMDLFISSIREKSKKDNSFCYLNKLFSGQSINYLENFKKSK